MIFKRMIIIALAFSPLIACTTTPPAPAVSDDGLVLVEKNDLDTFYMVENLNLKGYSTILINTPTIEFRKFWLRDQNVQRNTLQTRIRPEDMEKITTELSQLFVERFTRTLELAGYSVTDTPGDKVLELTPTIVDLDVFNPNLSYRQSAPILYSNGQQTSQMTLIMELSDAGSETALARATDKLLSPRIVPTQVGNNVMDPSSTTFTLDRWARKLVDTLNEAGA